MLSASALRCSVLRCSALLGLTALLMACSDAVPDPTRAQAPAALGGIYQLDIQIDGDSGQARVARVSASGTAAALAPQSLEAVQTDVQLSQPLTTSTFVGSRTGTSIRHISTSFVVTNTTGQTLSNLTLLPVILSDVDGDPSNNAVAPTIPGTPYRRVMLFGGQDASAQAAQLQATRGQQVSVQTGYPSINPLATPFMRGLEVSSVQPAAPAGLSLTVMPEGWVTRGTLAPGAAVPVTFAVDLPVDRQRPESQVFSFSLLFTTAQDLTGSAVSPTSPDVVRGVLGGTTFPQGTEIQVQYLEAGQWTTRQTVPLNPSRTLNFTLGDPPAAALDDLLPCTFTGQRSQATAKSAEVTLKVVGPESDVFGQVVTEDLTRQKLTRLYVDRDIRLQGRCDFPELDSALAYQDQLDLKRGWNLVQQHTMNLGTTLTVVRTSVPDDAWTRPVFTLQRPWVEVQSPAWDSDLTLRAGQSITVPLSLRQNGSISGDITLETDMPGVTVTPATLTLPTLMQTLGSSGLTPQALQSSITVQAAPELTAVQGPLTLTLRQNGTTVGFVRWNLNLTR